MVHYFNCVEQTDIAFCVGSQGPNLQFVGAFSPSHCLIRPLFSPWSHSHGAVTSMEWLAGAPLPPREKDERVRERERERERERMGRALECDKPERYFLASVATMFHSASGAQRRRQSLSLFLSLSPSLFSHPSPLSIFFLNLETMLPPKVQ